MTLGPRAAEKGQHSSCGGLDQMVPWLSFLRDQQGYCGETQSRLLSWPGPEAPLPDAELAPWAHPGAPAFHIIRSVPYRSSVSSHLLAAEAWDSLPRPTQTAQEPVKRAPLLPHGRHILLLFLDMLELRWRHSMSKKKVWCQVGGHSFAPVFQIAHLY